MLDFQKVDRESDAGADKPSSGNEDPEAPSGSYYYDDATGYEIYQGDLENEEDENAG